MEIQKLQENYKKYIPEQIEIVNTPRAETVVLEKEPAENFEKIKIENQKKGYSIELFSSRKDIVELSNLALSCWKEFFPDTKESNPTNY